MPYKIIPIFVPHMGCPNDCVFCNQNKISGSQSFSLDQSKKQIQEALIKNQNSQSLELAFYGGSFTMIEEDLQRALLELGKDLKERDSIQRIRLSTRPDGIDQNKVDFLKNYRVDIVELGVQSLDPQVLHMSKRGHGQESVYGAAEIIKKSGLKLGLQQMVGLPGDSLKKSIETTKKIISIGPDFVRIYPTLVIKNTELGQMYKSGLYEPLSLAKAIDWTSRIALYYSLAKIKIIRIGLQAAENLSLDKDVLAGPHHDAFGELVASNILVNAICKQVPRLEEGTSIKASSRIISLIVGQKAQGKAYLKKHYGISKLKFAYDNNLGDKILISSYGNIDIDQAFRLLVGADIFNVFEEY